MMSPYQRLGRWLSARRTPRGRWAFLLGGAVISASLLALYSRVEAPWFALGFVALVPWLFAQDRVTSLREAAGAGLAMSVAFVALVFSWLPGAAERYSHGSPFLLWLIFLVAAPVLEPQFLALALVRCLVRRASGRSPALRAAIAAACAYVATELLFSKLLFDTLGLGLYPSLYLRQAADIAGAHGLTLMLLLFNEGITETIRRWASASAKGNVEDGAGRRALVPMGCAMGLALVQLVYGYLRHAQIEARSAAPGTVIGVVQANITNYDKLRAEKGAYETVRTILDTHMALSDELRARQSPDFIVWPETVYPTTFGSPKSEAGAAFDEEITTFSKSRGVPLVFGAYDVEREREFNAAFFLSAAKDGQASHASYRKTMLFPFTERVPDALDSDWLRREMPWTGHWERGPGPRVMKLDLARGRSISVVPLICYDVLFSGFVAEAAKRGADLIVTLSNDSWFPDERAPRLHLISAAFRSVETRLPQVRATNSGISAMIAPTGEITRATGWNERKTLVGSLAGAGRMTTPAMVLGPWLGPALLSAALLFAAHAAVRGRAQPQKKRPKRGANQSKRRAAT